MEADELDWNRTLREQWEFHWQHQLTARLDGLTDDEYFRSPVPELIHHRSEACLLRDRYLRTKPATNGATR